MEYYVATPFDVRDFPTSSYCLADRWNVSIQFYPWEMFVLNRVDSVNTNHHGNSNYQIILSIKCVVLVLLYKTKYLQ